MGFGFGQLVKVWSVDTEASEKYAVCSVSASQKNRDGDGYQVNFSNKFVRFIGPANTKIRELEIPEKGLDIFMGYDDTTQYKGKDGTYKSANVIKTFSTMHWENKKPVPDDDDWKTEPYGQSQPAPANSTKTTAKKETKAKSSAHTDDSELPF